MSSTQPQPVSSPSCPTTRDSIADIPCCATYVAPCAFPSIGPFEWGPCCLHLDNRNKAEAFAQPNHGRQDKVFLSTTKLKRFLDFIIAGRIGGREETQGGCALVRARATLLPTLNKAYQLANNHIVHSPTPQLSVSTPHPPHGPHSSRPPGGSCCKQKHPPPTQPSLTPRHSHLGPAPTTRPQRHHHPASHAGHSLHKQPSRQHRPSRRGTGGRPAPASRHQPRVARSSPSANPPSTAAPLVPLFPL